MNIRPFLGTLCGVVLGVVALVIWMATFQPHGGVELSSYLFPVSAMILERLYPNQSIPVPLFYGGALLQWVVGGAIVDVLRAVLRKLRRKDRVEQSP